MLSGDKSYAESIYTDMLEYINDGSQSHVSINIREARYKKCLHALNGVNRNRKELYYQCETLVKVKKSIRGFC